MKGQFRKAESQPDKGEGNDVFIIQALEIRIEVFQEMRLLWLQLIYFRRIVITTLAFQMIGNLGTFAALFFLENECVKHFDKLLFNGNRYVALTMSLLEFGMAITLFAFIFNEMKLNLKRIWVWVALYGLATGVAMGTFYWSISVFDDAASSTDDNKDEIFIFHLWLCFRVILLLFVAGYAKLCVRNGRLMSLLVPDGEEPSDGPPSARGDPWLDASGSPILSHEDHDGGMETGGAM